jgi:hypothetical protein
LTIFLTVDTCVWINIASRPVLTPALDHLEEALRGDVKLVVPSVVLDELKRHLPDTVDRAVKSLTGQLKASKDAARWITSRASADAVRSAVDAVLKDLDASHSVNSVSDRILGFVETADAVRVDTDDALKVAAMDRALAKRAPCHNSQLAPYLPELPPPVRHWRVLRLRTTAPSRRSRRSASPTR